MCDADCECRICSKTMRSSCKPTHKYHKPDDPTSRWKGLLPAKNKPLSIYDRALQILKSEGLLPDEPMEPKEFPSYVPTPIPCFMASSYDKDFPPLEPSSNPERNLFSRPFVQTTEVFPDGSLKQPSQSEQVINWHSCNARVQNRVLHSIDQKIDQVAYHVSQHDLNLQHLDSSLRNMYTDLQSRVARLDTDLHQYINQGYFENTTSIESSTPSESSYESYSSWETYRPTSTDQSYRSDPDAQPDFSQIYMASRTEPQPSTQTVDTSDTSNETSEEPTLIVEEPPDCRPFGPIPTQKPTNGPWFNFDDLATRQWRRRMSEMSAWLDLQTANSSSGTSKYSGPDLPSEVYQATSDVNLGPQVQVQIMVEKYSKPVSAIAYFDTGAHSTMMNPKVLPPKAWKEEDNKFLVADGQIFIIKLVSRKKIGIQFFPSFTLWTHVIGTPLQDKDILIGWDVYSQSQSIRILPIGIRFKREFKPFTSIPKIFHQSKIPTNSRTAP
ncbi:hypothetical protein Ddye_015283 [Dipteronia dyeriana]|uniref:Uncharacterized protein n=1 Tax=Dipteronia dyeriana TaxID=168575 RepID=A0AAD9U5M2_9ROSI|nr:hypothetical protein Ddye_015283 [Dipteronia dyeriana]